MTTFIDGPAKGRTLMLQRSPKYLRVVQSGSDIDALDLVEDEPHPSEIVFAYVIQGAPTVAFIDGTDKRGRRTGGRYSCAQYALVNPQPSESDMRLRGAWVDWVEKKQGLR